MRSIRLILELWRAYRSGDIEKLQKFKEKNEELFFELKKFYDLPIMKFVINRVIIVSLIICSVTVVTYFIIPCFFARIMEKMFSKIGDSLIQRSFYKKCQTTDLKNLERQWEIIETLYNKILVI